MKFAIFAVGTFLAVSHHSAADGAFHWITESDPGGPNNVVLTSSDSLTDLTNLNVASSSPIFGLPGDISISGLVVVPTTVIPEPGGVIVWTVLCVSAIAMFRRRETKRA